MGTGFLSVTVTSALKSAPISKARVIIKDGSGRDLHTLETSRSGSTATVMLEAPDKKHTLAPSSPGPFYGKYEAIVTAFGYETSVIKDVQIFDTITSNLPVRMLPIRSVQGSVCENDICIPKNALDVC